MELLDRKNLAQALPPGLEHLQISDIYGNPVENINSAMQEIAGEIATATLESLAEGNKVQFIAPLTGVVPIYTGLMHQLAQQLTQFPGLTPLDVRNSIHFMWFTSNNYLSADQQDATQIVHSRLGVGLGDVVTQIYIDDVLDKAGTHNTIRAIVDEQISKREAKVSSRTAWFVGIKNRESLASLPPATAVNYHLTFPDVWINTGAGMNSSLYDYKEALAPAQVLTALEISRLERLIPIAITGRPTSPEEYLNWLRAAVAYEELDPITGSLVVSSKAFLGELDKLRMNHHYTMQGNILQNLTTAAVLWHAAKLKKLFPTSA